MGTAYGLRLATLGLLSCHLTSGTYHCVCGDIELRVNVIDFAGCSEFMHADEYAVQAEIAVPGIPHGCFDGDPGSAAAQHRLLVGGILLLEQQPARHRNNGRANTLVLQHRAGFDRQIQFRAGGKDRQLPLAAFSFLENVGSPCRAVLVGRAAA